MLFILTPKHKNQQNTSDEIQIEKYFQKLKRSFLYGYDQRRYYQL